MYQEIPRIMLAAPSSHSGKTVITCAILRALQRRGMLVSPFKCGPDYIDPMFHRQVFGTWGGNLDSFFLETEELKAQLYEGSQGTEISVIEGVMGYYDGLGGHSLMASTWEVASKTLTPAVLIVDGKGASLSLVALIKGFLTFREDHKIAGVILNRTSKVVYERLTPWLSDMGIKPLGFIPECEEARLESRHLGLKMPDEVAAFSDRLDLLAKKLEETLLLDQIIEISRSAKPLLVTERKKGEPLFSGLSIGVAKDQAFCFYYEENLRLFRELGAELIYFSPLKDAALPAGICGLLLGGGYPENYARSLSENQSMLTSVREALKKNMPVLAECGGFLYLHQYLEGTDQKEYPMVGMVEARGISTPHLNRFGYIELFPQTENELLPVGESIKGHEFHYWDSEMPGDALEARKPLSDRSWKCMQEGRGMLMGFPHLYYPSNPRVVVRWLEQCRLYKEKINDGNTVI